MLRQFLRLFLKLFEILIVYFLVFIAVSIVVTISTHKYRISLFLVWFLGHRLFKWLRWYLLHRLCLLKVIVFILIANSYLLRWFRLNWCGINNLRRRVIFKLPIDLLACDLIRAAARVGIPVRVTLVLLFASLRTFLRPRWSNHRLSVRALCMFIRTYFHNLFLFHPIPDSIETTAAKSGGFVLRTYITRRCWFGIVLLIGIIFKLRRRLSFIVCLSCICLCFQSYSLLIHNTTIWKLAIRGSLCFYRLPPHLLLKSCHHGCYSHSLSKWRLI